jgi:autotransporter-associated beta strand protein
MKDLNVMRRRDFLRGFAGVSAGLAVAPVVGRPSVAAAASSPAPTETLAFVDAYQTNVLANLTAETNAAIRILSGMARLWKTGPTWDGGLPLAPGVLRANLTYCAQVTAARTDAQARLAFIADRQHQSYAVIAGLGPLADLYRSGAKAVTSITVAPDGTPPTRINDVLPAGAPAGSAIGAGAPDSALGRVVELVNTVRGGFSSSNPAKVGMQYPRPWRMNVDSQVVDTGARDALGYPIYDSDVVVAPQLLRQRSETPADDGGYPSGHSNALYLAALALAYAVPERFQELVVRAGELSDTRIVAGMHSPVDVVGGRILATALAAAILQDPRNAALKAAARTQAAEYFQTRTGSTADTLAAYAHSAGPDTDPYADREVNAAAFTPRLTYILTRSGRSQALTVPKGAEVLLETRLPYLSAKQRREVLSTTALPSGYDLLDGPEEWGRLNLFAAADGYGAFIRDVQVEMDAAAGGFSAADVWRNDIQGSGGLIKTGTGTLTLTGANQYSGGTFVEAGTLVAGSPGALGRGRVDLRAGTLRLAPEAGEVRVHDDYRQRSGAALTVTAGDGPLLSIAGRARLARGSRLELRLGELTVPAGGLLVTVLRARSLSGRFDTVTLDDERYRTEPSYTADGLSVRLLHR